MLKSQCRQLDGEDVEKSYLDLALEKLEKSYMDRGMHFPEKLDMQMLKLQMLKSQWRRVTWIVVCTSRKSWR